MIQTSAAADPAALSRVGPALVVAGFVAIALGYVAFVPVFAAPDEPFHFEYARHLAQTGALPDPTDGTDRVSTEAMGPPLYYATAALVLRATAASLADDLVVHRHADVEHLVRALRAGRAEPAAARALRPALNPRYVKWGVGDEPNMFLRAPGDRFPWSGGAAALRWMRLLSVLCGAATVWLVHRIARLALPARPELALLAAGLVAFDPQFAFLSASVNNDAAAVLLSTAALLVCTQLLQDRAPSPRREWWLGVWIGLALMAKTNAAFLVPIALGVVLVRARGAVRDVWPGLLRVGLPIAGIAGWFVVRGAILYGPGDPLGFALRAAQNPDLVLPDELRAAFFADVFGPRLFQSAFGLFDWVTLPMPGPAYAFYGVLLGVGVAGLLVRSVGDDGRRERAWTVLYLAALGLTLAALVFLNLTFHSAQARLLFPAIGGAATLLAAGLGTAFESALRGPALRTAPLALVVVLAGVSVSVLLGVVAPAYAG